MNKRISALILSVLMIVSLAACRTKKQETAQVSDAYTVPATMTPHATTTPSPVEIYVPGVETLDEPLVPFEESTASDSTSAPQPTETPDDSDSPSPTETPDEPELTPAPAEPLTEYEAYNAMSGEEQEAFFETFDSMADFVAWYNNAQAEYEATHSAIEVGDGTIDLSEIINGQS